jgi:protein TonB
MATHQLVATSPQPAQVSATGAPVIELDKGTTEAPANEYHPPVPVDPPAPEVVAQPEPAPEPVVEQAPEPAPSEDHGPDFIDLSVLTPEQVAAIESIAHPEV